MANNFAFRFGSGGAPGLSTTPFLNAYSQLPQGTQGEWNYNDPSTGFEYFLKQLNPSMAQDRSLRSLYESLWRRFGIDSLSNPNMNSGGWMQWLGKQDWNKEYAGLDPRQRGDSGSQYMRPARWVAFT